MSSRDRRVLVVLALAVLAVGGWFVIVKPAHSRAGQLSTQIAAARTSLSQAEAEVQSGQQAEAEYSALARQLKSLEAAVPADLQVPQLIDDLQSAANRTDVGFQSISTGTSTATATPTAGATTTQAAVSFPSQSLNLSFTGDYFAVARLLGTVARYVRTADGHIHATHRLIVISSVDLSPGLAQPTTVKSGTGPVTATVSATDFYIPATLSAGATTTATATP